MTDLARRKLLQPQEPIEIPEDDEAEKCEETMGSGKSKKPANPIEGVESIMGGLSEIKNWMVESMSMFLENPSDTTKELHEKIQALHEANPTLGSVLDLDEVLQMDFSKVGQKLREAENAVDAIQKDLRAAGSTKRPGRPFGSKNKEAPKAKKQKKNEKDIEEAGLSDVEMGKAKSSPPTDPFADLEASNKNPNKCATISLYSKCLVVEAAKQLHQEGGSNNLEREIMVRFKKYFYSYETERWKTGLLNKWWKYLAFYRQDF